MSDITFRALRADEVECRVNMIKDSGLSLLLYKDARCDMNILDETVGAERWQRKHYECKGNMYCSVGIQFEQEWVWKDDCGAESFTEKEKGEASDSFKRAAVNWGIGRELYTSPFIWIPSTLCKIVRGSNSKLRCDTRFKVSNFSVADLNGAKVIEAIEIIDEKDGKVVFSWGAGSKKVSAPKSESKKAISKVVCPKCGRMLTGYINKRGEEVTAEQELQLLGMCKECYKESKTSKG